MKPQTAILKLRTRLNKIHSSDYDNIEDWAAVEAINKAALEVYRNLISGKTPTQEGAEETSTRVSDLQQFLKPLKLKGSNAKPHYFEAKLPEDFFRHNLIVPLATKGGCQKKPLISNFREEANAQVLLEDYNTRPSFEWRETFHTLLSNKIRVYTANEFEVELLEGSYYRKPRRMDIHGYDHEDGTPSDNVDLEFTDDLAEIIIDYAASIIAGDIESLNQAQINLQRLQTNI